MDANAFSLIMIAAFMMFLLSGFIYFGKKSKEDENEKPVPYKHYKTGIVGFIPPDSSEIVPQPEEVEVKVAPSKKRNNSANKNSNWNSQNVFRNSLFNRMFHKGPKRLLHKGEYQSK